MPGMALGAGDSFSREQSKVSLLGEMIFQDRKTEKQTDQCIVCQAMTRAKATIEKGKRGRKGWRPEAAAGPGAREGLWQSDH